MKLFLLIVIIWFTAATVVLGQNPNITKAKQPVSSNTDWTPRERNFRGTTMVLVPVGSFNMGSGEGQISVALELCDNDCVRDWFVNEMPINTQDFDKPFWLDKTEVTRDAYQSCVSAGKCTPAKDNRYSTADDQPINNVTWYQAATYCKWRRARLPTEAEWEYSARGPDGLIYPWGNEFDDSRLEYVNGLNYGTVAVGSDPSSASWVGALDMSGNLWEWTNSFHRHYPYSKTDGREVPKGADKDDIVEGITLRGSSFIDQLNNSHAANRDWNYPYAVNYATGFRCARSLKKG